MPWVLLSEGLAPTRGWRSPQLIISTFKKQNFHPKEGQQRLGGLGRDPGSLCAAGAASGARGSNKGEMLAWGRHKINFSAFILLLKKKKILADVDLGLRTGKSQSARSSLLQV